MSDSLRPHGLYSSWNSPGQNTWVSSLSLLQGLFPTQGSNWGLLHCRQILYQLSHKGSPRILEWVVYPFSSKSSQPRNWTGISRIASRFFTNWATREALFKSRQLQEVRVQEARVLFNSKNWLEKKKRIGWGLKWWHSYKGRTCDHKVAAGSCQQVLLWEQLVVSLSLIQFRRVKFSEM